MILALAGNQNSGKTTLFNQLTGANQHVGNFPGVTVERKDGLVRGQKAVTVVDLPGIYSLSPYSNEEIVTRDFLLTSQPDGIINIVDATNIERNLYLSLQLIELGLPMVIALNMMDEVRANGGTIRLKEFSEALGVPVVPIAAVKNDGVDDLISVAVETARQRKRPARQDFCRGAVHRAIHSTAHIVEDHAQRVGVSSRFAAIKLLEGDPPMLEQLGLSENEKELLEHTVVELETELGTDREAALADMRYTFIEQLCEETVVKPQVSAHHRRSVEIDKLLTHRYLAIPIFIGIMLFIFWMTFGVIGSYLSDGFAGLIDGLGAAVGAMLERYGINPVVRSLVVDGVFAGVGSVLSFLPTITLLFFFLSMLEDSGYMARVAFVMDKPLRKIGLSGRSFVPMLIGFGCTVPAIMATRTLSSERDRKMTILLTPFMSCSAKLPIYGMFSLAFFPEHPALVMIALYLLGMLTGIVSGLLMKRTAFRGKPVPFVMELPNYRLPGAKNVVLLLWDKIYDFLTRAFTIIFLASVLIWFLQTFDSRLNVVVSSDQSMLAAIGEFLAPMFAPLGCGDWRASTALLTGLTAKEAVISSLAVLTNSSLAALPQALRALFSAPAACAYLTFTLLYPPCVAAIAAVRRELGGKYALFVVVYQIAVAWVVAFLVYHLAGFLF